MDNAWLLIDLMTERRSVRRYLRHVVEPEKIKLMLEAARLAPSAQNSQPWTFVVVRDPLIISRLFTHSIVTYVANAWAQIAPVVIVCCLKKKIVPHKLVPSIYNIPLHYLDMGAAIEQMLLEAAALGLGTCWIGVFNQRWVKKILHIPSSSEIVSLITVGYPAHSSKKEKKRKSLADIVFFDRFGKKGR